MIRDNNVLVNYQLECMTSLLPYSDLVLVVLMLNVIREAPQPSVYACSIVAVHLRMGRYRLVSEPGSYHLNITSVVD